MKSFIYIRLESSEHDFYSFFVDGLLFVWLTEHLPLLTQYVSGTGL